MRKQIISVLATVTMVAVATLAIVSAQAQEKGEGKSEKKCQLNTIKGSFGYLNTGTAFGTALASVGVIIFDGSGNVAGNDTNSFGGAITSNAPFTGTYTVNADCTGTLIVNFGFFSITNNMVIVDNGKEINIIETNPGTVATGVFKHQ